MKAGNREADLLVDFEPSRGSQEVDLGRFERVFGWELMQLKAVKLISRLITKEEWDGTYDHSTMIDSTCTLTHSTS